MLNISGIENGYVIDHIKAGKSLVIYDLLNLDDYEGQVAIIKNARSQKQGMKDIIKIEGAMDIDLDFLGFLDDNITINVIKDGNIIEKKKLEVAEEDHRSGKMQKSALYHFSGTGAETRIHPHRSGKPRIPLQIL